MMRKQAMQVVNLKGVRAVGQSAVRVRVDFEKEGVAAGGDGRAGQRGNHLALARGGRAAGPALGAGPSGLRRRPPARRWTASGGWRGSR